MKNLNIMLRKCKTFSKQLTRSSSYINPRSNSATHHHPETTSKGIIWNTNAISVYGDNNNLTDNKEEPRQLVFVGSTKKGYVINSKYLVHPLVNALIVKSKKSGNDDDDDDYVWIINCEVVLFDHLLWMLENADFNVTSDCLDELADLYLF